MRVFIVGNFPHLLSLMQATCIFLMADLKTEILIFYIIFNFSKNLHVGMEIILNHVFYIQNGSCNL